jgi:hypothetical protein
MAHTPTGVKQVQSVLRKEIDDFSLVLGGRSSNSLESASQRRPLGTCASAPDRYHLNRMGAAAAPRWSGLASSRNRPAFLS